MGIRVGIGLIMAVFSTILGACALMKPSGQPDTGMIPFESVGGQLIKVPVIINGDVPAQFLIDTGAGVNLMSTRLCRLLQCKTSGVYTGQRMSGEEISVSFTTLDEVRLGAVRRTQERFAVSEIFSGLPAELGRIDGALSLRFFEKLRLTIDYRQSHVILDDRPNPEAVAIPLQIVRDAEKTVAFIDIKKFGSFEFDTGNSLAILNLSHAFRAGVDVQDQSVTKVESPGPTGFPTVAYYTTLPDLTTAASPYRQERPKVAFKKLIYDGVLGNDFFKDRRVTIDVDQARIYVD